MDQNRIVLLLFFFTTVLFSSLFLDIKRKRQESKLNNHIEKTYELQIRNQEKANWHKGFQVATGITLFILFMQLVPHLLFWVVWYLMTFLDAVMLSLPTISLLVGFFKYRLDETDNFTYGFFMGSLIALTLYAQTSDSLLTWLKV